MPKHRRTRDKPACPACGGLTMRVPRGAGERAATDLRQHRRFRCSTGQCNWTGLLSVHRPQAAAATTVPAIGFVAPVTGTNASPSASTPAGWSRWVPAGALLFVGFALAGSALLADRTMRSDLMVGSDGQPVLLGESDYGVALPAAHPLLVRAGHAPDKATAALPEADTEPALALRQNCAWGRPGGNPYQGTVEEALSAARLPPEVVQKVAAKVKAGDSSDDLVIGNDGIHGQRAGRDYSARGFAMTYGRTICLNTRVNFRPGHVERAALYEVSDAQGQRHAVMVPEVCGNVSVLSDRGRRAPSLLLTAGGTTLQDLAASVASEGGRRVALSTTHSVPEPGTLLGALTGLALLGWFSRRR